MGRPKKTIDYDLVTKLSGIMCTQEEIATVLNIAVRTLQNDEEFMRIYKKGLEEGKMALRRIQFTHAKTNPAMAMFLGKNYLGQSDKQEHDVGGNVNINVKWEK